MINKTLQIYLQIKIPEKRIRKEWVAAGLSMDQTGDFGDPQDLGIKFSAARICDLKYMLEKKRVADLA